jgi:hypothetical protein
MLLSVTPLYALPVAAIYLVLWFRVSAARSAAGVSFGDGVHYLPGPRAMKKESER